MSQSGETNVEETPAEEISTKRESIKVCVRIRPMNKNEKGRGDEEALDFNQTTININTNMAPKSKGTAPREKQFTYDLCFGPEASQDDVFGDSGIVDLLKFALEGYSSTVFAYGQTGCGKTHTIIGDDVTPGIVPRACIYLFDFITQLLSEDNHMQIKVRASCLEIYQEQVNDLLNMNGTNLPVRWSNRDGFFVEHLCIVEVENIDELMTVFNEGASNRKVASHELNKDSSRSHSIFTIYLDITSQDPEGFKSKRYGSIRFVDLAGSEKLKVSKSKSASETSSINKSLLVLGKVISLLSSTKKDVYVPYRDSKLTKLLMDSLGGESKTLMIACINLSAVNIEETHKTLTYASRVKKIKNIPITKIDDKEKYIMKLKEEIRLLKEELALYKTKAGATSFVTTPQPKLFNRVGKNEVKSVEFPQVERKRISAKNVDVLVVDHDKLPNIERKSIAARAEEELRGVNNILKIVEKPDETEEEDEKKREISNAIEGLKYLLEEERQMNLEKIPQLKAKIKVLTDDNKRWKRIVRQNMDFDSENYEKMRLENQYYKKLLEEHGIDTTRKSKDLEAEKEKLKNEQETKPPTPAENGNEEKKSSTSNSPSKDTKEAEKKNDTSNTKNDNAGDDDDKLGYNFFGDEPFGGL